MAKFVACEGYGFIETADGREVYFHRNSVLDDAFERAPRRADGAEQASPGEPPVALDPRARAYGPGQ